MYYHFKYIIDFIASAILTILLIPIIAIISICLYITNNGNVFFSQMRPGKNGKLFMLIKFRTMTDQVNDFGELLPDEKRLTKLGRFIRSTSLDELPQLWNILKGDMSFIGPRPLLPEYLSLYTPEQSKRHNVKPGLTGWAQVNGRNQISWKQKFEYDIWYVDNISLTLDFKIFLLTIKKVIKREGINSDNNATIEKFNGHN